MDTPTGDWTPDPTTEYTRAHWVFVAERLLSGAWRWASPSGSLLALPGPASVSGARSDGLEGYARTFLAAAFLAAGGDTRDWLSRYADGLIAGTRTPGRDDAESWPRIGHQHLGLGQPMVESASIALGLRLTRPWLWDALPGDAQDRVADWLSDALTHNPAPNNWHLFPFTVAGFLESVGRGSARTASVRERARMLLELWYAGDGWYSDGDGRAFDHYNGWALHLYPALDAYLSGVDSPYGPRLHTHLDGFSALFGADGAPVYFGRSLTYRFAATAAVGLGAVTGHTPLPPGQSRALIGGALRYFLSHGAMSDDDLLSRGWHGSHAATLQPYSGPASPYWASKAFVCLLAPSDHPLWTEPESRSADRVFSIAAPGFLVQSVDGIARLHNHGSDSVHPLAAERAADENPLYGRQAYSTATGPTALGDPPDNQLSVVVDGLRSVRRRIHPLGAGHGDGWGWAASWHRPVFGGPIVPGLRVVSVTVAVGAYELRVHEVIGAPAGAVVEQTGWATGPDNSVRSALFPLHGWTAQDVVHAPAGTAFTRVASIPRLTGHGTTFAAVATLGAELPNPITDVTVTAGGIELAWTTGATTAVTFDPVTVTHS